MRSEDWIRWFALHREREMLRGDIDGPWEYLNFEFDHPKGPVVEHRFL